MHRGWKRRKGKPAIEHSLEWPGGEDRDALLVALLPIISPLSRSLPSVSIVISFRLLTHVGAVIKRKSCPALFYEAFKDETIGDVASISLPRGSSSLRQTSHHPSSLPRCNLASFRCIFAVPISQDRHLPSIKPFRTPIWHDSVATRDPGRFCAERCNYCLPAEPLC